MVKKFRTFNIKTVKDIRLILELLDNKEDYKVYNSNFNLEYSETTEDIYQFEPIDDVTAKRIGEAMIQELKFWEPRINVNNLLVVANADQMRYDITMSYDVEACDIGRNSIEFILQQ